jgi:hypothetical protein
VEVGENSYKSRSVHGSSLCDRTLLAINSACFASLVSLLQQKRINFHNLPSFHPLHNYVAGFSKILAFISIFIHLLKERIND